MGKQKCLKMPGKKWIVGILVMAAVGAAAVVLFVGNGQNVEFRTLSEKEYPQEISSDIIPEYRSLERALACLVDEKVYVVVTRGEKPASGYNVKVKKMKLDNENGKETLVVYASFKEPEKGDSMSQVLTYPIEVTETGLKRLPDEIELRVQYEE